MSAAIVLFAHGSREAEWSAPFERLARLISARRPEARVVSAYLEHLHPTLEQAVASLAAEDASEIVVVPVFLAPGGHVKRDLPERVDALRTRHRGVTIRVLPTVGEAEPLLDAIAAWIVSAAR